ncbi:unnamed protein product [Sympodiomycopsis kandeliae]
MSNPTPNQTTKNQNAQTPAAGNTTFNYAAAAAAKSKQQQQQQQQQAQAQAQNSTNQPSGTTANNNSSSSDASSAPATKSSANGNAQNNTKAAAPVSMASGNSNTNPANAATVNFGSVHDSSAALSSSPAVQPKSGQHLQGDKPALFGSVAAAAAQQSQQKVVGFSGSTNNKDAKTETKDGQAAAAAAAAAAPAAAAARPAMDFQKLFQTGGNKKPAAQAAQPAANAPTEKAPAPTASENKPVNQQPNANALRPPQQSGAQPFEPQQSPAAPFTPAAAAPSPSPGLRTPQQQHQQQPQQGATGPQAQAQPFHPHQQQRSPMPPPQQHNMMGQPGAHPGHPQWQGQPGYYPPQYMQQYSYQYGAAPQPWQPGGPQPNQQQQQQQPQQQPYDPAAASRSPRHSTNQAAPPPGSSVASPASSRPQAAPYSPSTAPSSIASPQMLHGAHPQHHQHHHAHQHHPHHPLGMGLPSGPRPPGGPYHQPSGSYGGGGHGHTHSFGAAGVNPLSPSARQFEPGQAQKRVSSAIRIVNPDTKAAIDIKSPAPKPAATATTPAAAATSSPSNAAATAAPAAPASATSSPAPAPAAAAATASPSPSPAAAKPATSSAASSDYVQPANKSAPKTPAKPLATQQSFHAQVQARIAARKAAEEAEAAEKKKAESDAEAEKKKAADAEAAQKRQEEEKAADEKKQSEEEAARKEAERKEAEAKAASEAQEKAAREKDAAEAKAAEQTKKDEETARQAQAAEADKAVDNSKLEKGSEAATEAKLNAQDAVVTGEKTGAEAGKDAAASAGAAKSVADIERMAREVSSVPSTPLEPVPRTPLFPTTPRTPGTPGFAGLPAKPMSNINNQGSSNATAAGGGATPAAAAAATAATNGAGNFNLDSAQLESRRRPSQLDTAAAQRASSSTASNATPASGSAGTSNAAGAAAPAAATAETPVSAASASLGSARFIDDLNKVTYPTSVQSPKKELNQSAEPGKFRYDRDFLLQFMGVYSEKPQDMPALASIGMEQGQMGAGGGRAGSGRRASGIPPGGSSGRGGQNAGGLGLGIGGGSGFGRGAGGMGQFSHPAKTSEERFAQANAGRGAPGGAFGSSGPMGSFAGGRTQPLSRGGSGSGALPSRDMMGTGTPAGGRTQSRRGRTREPGQGRGGNVNPPEKGGPTIPMDQVVPLSHSDNRWQAGSGQKLSDDSPELIQRKVKALLNKLTVEKFASISDQILDWANKSVDESDGATLRLVIALIFEKATDEAAWSEMYAQLCRKLMERVSTDVADESIKNGEGQPIVGGQLFRKYLLTRCQIDFERGWAHRDAMVDAAKGKEAEDKAKKESNDKAEADAKEATERGEKTEEKEAELMSEEYYAAQKAKRRGLGLVRFIGELYKLQMLTERIIHSCLKKLLQNTKDPEEEEIESLCKLLTTVGAQLDTDRARSHMDIYVLRMQEMTKSEAVNSRMKFMLLDVIELRAAGWKGKQQSAGPKSIAQIHEDAAKQKQQAEAELAARSSSGRGMPPSRGGSRRGQQRGDFGPGGGPMGHDGWTAVGAGAPPPPRPTRAGDMSGFGKIERSGSGRPLSLGLAPNNVFAKKQQKTSEDGSKPPSRTASSTNMFEMLGQAESEQAAQQQQQQQAASGGGGGGERPKLKLAPRTKPYPGSTGEGDEEGEGEEEDDDEKKAGEDGAAELSEEDLKRKVDNDIKEFLAVRDVKEGALAMESLPASQRSEFIAKIVEVVLNKKEDDVRTVGRLFNEVRSSSLMDDSSFETGFKKSGMDMLDDISIDVPSVYKFMAILVVASGLPQDKVEALAETIEGDGLKPPKTKFLEKVQAERDEQ